LAFKFVMWTTLMITAATATFVLAAEGPCDIYSASGTPCVAAHSTVRALFGNYNGPLYQVKRADNKETFDVGLLTAGGYANSASQDAFCGTTYCFIHRIYDQSDKHNHLAMAPQRDGSGIDKPANASKDKLMVGGHFVYSVYFEGGMGYRNDTTTGIAKGDEAETMYMVTSGIHYNDRCCFDYGNAETDNHDDGAGTMEAVYFGSANGGMNHGGVLPGPWIMADMENALWGANITNSQEALIQHDFVTAMVKGDSGPAPGHWAIKGGDAQKGELKVFWDGWRAKGYAPMKKQGAIIMGIGGDNSDKSIGTFYEGVITHGYTSDEADAAVQANIVAAGYGK